MGVRRVRSAVSAGGDGSALGPAARRVLADEVADALREAIMTGRFESGQRLIEHELATQLAVSRGPVPGGAVPAEPGGPGDRQPAPRGLGGHLVRR